MSPNGAATQAIKAGQKQEGPERQRPNGGNTTITYTHTHTPINARTHTSRQQRLAQADEQRDVVGRGETRTRKKETEGTVAR